MWKGATGCVPFGPGLSAPLACSSLTGFIVGSPSLVMPPSLAPLPPWRCQDRAHLAVRSGPKGRVTLSPRLRTPPLLAAHASIGYCGRNRRCGHGIQPRHTIKQATFTSHPHIGVERSFGDVAIDRYFFVLIALTKDAAVALLDLGGLPRRVEMMQGDKAFLDVGAGTHFLGAADQHAHRTLPDLLEEGLLLGVGFGVAHGGYLLAGDAVGDELLDDV